MYSEFWQINLFIFPSLSPSNPFVFPPLICVYLSPTCSFFLSLITVSGPEGVFPLGWQQHGDRERETGRASSGEAWQTPLIIFPPPPIDSVSSGSVLAWSLSSEGLDNMPSSAIRVNLSQAHFRDRSRRKWLSSHCHFFHF